MGINTGYNTLVESTLRQVDHLGITNAGYLRLVYSQKGQYKNFLRC